MSNRAGQFMPFSALKGFYELIKEKERVIVPKHEIAEDKAEELSEKMKLIKRGMMVKIVYYSDGEYVSAEGIVTKIDLTFRKITIVKNDINLDDVWEIEF